MWLFKDKEFSIDERGNAIAFVYIISNLVTGREYIGKKLFYSHKYKQVNKKRKKIKIESDWMDYWSSSNELKQDIENLGEDKFKREILVLCENRGTASYVEAKLQMQHEVLEHPDKWYNGIVNVRVNRKHLKL